MRHILDAGVHILSGGLTITAWLLATWMALIMIEFCTPSVHASNTPSEMSVYHGIRQLSPQLDPAVAASWAGVLWHAGAETDIDPLLLTAIAFRESSFRDSVVGNPDAPAEQQDIGAMQLRGAARQYMPRNCQDATDLSCNIRGGAAYLQYCRAVCGGSWDVWVGAYGMSSCPTEAAAAQLPSVIRAKTLYEQIGGTNWR